jgi:hypothetical protein
MTAERCCPCIPHFDTSIGVTGGFNLFREDADIHRFLANR